MNIFGKRLKKLRKDYSLTQKILASKLGIGQTTIANYENGSRFPNQQILKNFADFFNVSIDYLVGRTENTNTLSSTSTNINKDNINFYKLSNLYFMNLKQENIFKATNLLLELVSKNIKLEDIYHQIIEPSLVKVGDMWEKNELTVGEEHFFTEATKRIMSSIYSQYPIIEIKNLNALFFCAHGERHSIGIRMVSDILEQNGWKVYFLGTDLPIDSILSMIKNKKIDLIAISTTMDYNINSIKSMIKNIKLNCENKDIKFLVGGKPFNLDKTLVNFVGADGYAKNCKQVVKVANSLIKN
ncbi:cobalamin-dependent protein [Senegalia massiliensis]|uniref:Helix-turn-helix domain-containing protein n=1 Tax=Senegalia massiliensis TaxID=1720316 RepID=A0A845QTI6_9CLOT|nr:cobalamin-dependent protein [Senegalia massiliensis]NBI05855.1 helix-turn-helix domain-containing protein [Senegalia massiliensis]